MKKWLIAVSLLFFGITSANAQIQWQKSEYFQNSGGLNDAFSPIAIADNEAAALQNVVFTTSGSFKTRDGFAKINSVTLGSSVVCTGLKYFRPTSGTRFLVGVFDNDKIYKMDYGSNAGPDGTWDNITGALTFAIGQDNLASFAIGQDTLLIEDGLSSTPPYKWTGTGDAAALGGSPPNATMVAYHKRMGFAAGNASAPSTLYFSDVGDIENWSSALSGNVSIDTNDGSIIRAIIPGFDALYIFKDHSIWRLTGDDKDTFVLQRMVPDVGVLSSRAVDSLGNEFIFTSDQGNIYEYDGATGLKIISVKVDGTLGSANFNRFQYVNSLIFDNDYYLAFTNSGSTFNNRILTYDTFNAAWTKFVGMNPNAMAVADDGLGKNILVFGDYTGFAYQYPSGTSDAGTAIVASYLTKQFRFPEATPLKDWKLLRVFANQEGNYNINIDLRNDFVTTGTVVQMSLQGSAEALWGTAIWGTALYGGQNLVIGRFEPNLEGDFFQVRFYNETVNQPFEVKGYQIFIEGQDRL